MQLEKYIHIESDAVPLDFCDEIVKEYDDDEYERKSVIVILTVNFFYQF